MKILLKTAVFSLYIQQVFAACNGTWTGTLNDTWGTNGNWSPNTCFPFNAGDSATFSDSFRPNVNVDVAPTITTLTFNPATTTYTLGGVGPLTFGGNAPNLNVVSGNPTFSVPIILTSNTVFNLNSLAIFNSTINAASGQTLTLQGNGTLISQNATIETPTFANSGILFPALHLTVLGQYQQSKSGTLLVNVQNAATFSSISATTAALNGTLKVSIDPNNPILPGTSLTILSTSNGVTGTFSKVIGTNFPDALGPHVTYLPNAVLLNSIPVLNHHLVLREMIFSEVNQINLVLLKHMEKMNYETDCCMKNHLNVFAGPLGSLGTVHSKRNIVGYDFSGVGFLVGADYPFWDGGIGFAFDYERLHGTPFTSFNPFNVDQVHASIYGSYLAFYDLSFNFIVGGGYDFISLTRLTGLQSNELTQSRPNASLFDIFFGLEYLLTCESICQLPPNFSVMPVAGVQYINHDVKNYREKGVANYDLHLDNQAYESIRSIIGFKINALYAIGRLAITPQINLLWEREHADMVRRFSYLPANTSLSGSSFLVPEAAADILVTGVDFKLSFDRFFTDLSYEFEVSDRYLNHFVYVELGASF